MRRYNPNPKHESGGTIGRKGTPLGLTPLEAHHLLNDPVNCLEVPGKRQFVAVRKGQIYVFQDDGTGGFHAYPIAGNELCRKYPQVASRIAMLLQTTYKRLSNSH